MPVGRVFKKYLELVYPTFRKAGDADDVERDPEPGTEAW